MQDDTKSTHEKTVTYQINSSAATIVHMCLEVLTVFLKRVVFYCSREKTMQQNAVPPSALGGPLTTKGSNREVIIVFSVSVLFCYAASAPQRPIIIHNVPSLVCAWQIYVAVDNMIKHAVSCKTVRVSQ